MMGKIGDQEKKESCVKQPTSGSSVSIGSFILLSTIYLDSTMFSFATPLGRFRPNIVIIIGITLWSLINYLLTKKRKFTISRVEILLIAYIGVNIISLFFVGFDSLRISYGIRIIFLLVCWLSVFFYLTRKCSIELRALKLLKFFFLMGFLQTLIGTWQMLGTFVRPTGTISLGDADFFGIAIMGNLLVFVVLKVLKVQVLGKYLDYIFISLLTANLFFSFVRSGWFGFLAGLFFFGLLIVLGKIGKISLLGRKILSITLGIAFVVFILFTISPTLQDYAISRIFSSESDGNSIQNNIRLIMMAESWKNALNSPIIGNGPAAFAVQGLSLDIPLNADFAFDPSIITTLMNDTGIIGTAVFISFLWVLISETLSIYSKNPNNILAKYALAFVVAVFGLIIAYIPSTGLWLPYSWMFFGFAGALTAAVKSSV